MICLKIDTGKFILHIKQEKKNLTINVSLTIMIVVITNQKKSKQKERIKRSIFNLSF